MFTKNRVFTEFLLYVKPFLGVGKIQKARWTWFSDIWNLHFNGEETHQTKNHSNMMNDTQREDVNYPLGSE